MLLQNTKDYVIFLTNNDFAKKVITKWIHTGLLEYVDIFFETTNAPVDIYSFLLKQFNKHK